MYCVKNKVSVNAINNYLGCLFVLISDKTPIVLK